MKKIISLLIAVCVYLSLFSVGCFDPEFQLLGEWEATVSQKIDGINYLGTDEIQFKDDMRFKETLKLTSLQIDTDLEFIIQGDYEVKEEGKITVIYDKYTVNGEDVLDTLEDKEATLEYQLEGDVLTLIDENGSEGEYLKL